MADDTAAEGRVDRLTIENGADAGFRLAGTAPSGVPATPQDVLERICAQTLGEVARRSAALPLKEIKARLKDLHEAPRGFGHALKLKTAERQVGLIAEMKKSSPSAGPILASYDPAAIARLYEQAGAACLSVLTEGPSFGGHVADLQIARAAVSLPVLRKDFILEPWQVYESRLIGADCILLIMAALTDERAEELLSMARSLDLDVLVEVHDEPELDRALGLNTALIGINNRNLKTLKTELGTTLSLAPRVPPDRIVVAESGIRSREDVLRLAGAGASCFLVGESLLRQADPGEACASLLGPL
ncbi:indole-3-glycerol phosphate synthase TrpC [Rhizosaccharibacter radicis]|uniref:Indole-3-glycerol phosphate synthase n=1 Tax=Rhizosaccharibacter radicis TaxID=2782605 RepID=A0ABT1VV65_9PROT|nr:indole-3-glycerol phosphate synthase TrpC [Acetobacteraceae bacterium KSS12]